MFLLTESTITNRILIFPVQLTQSLGMGHSSRHEVYCRSYYALDAFGYSRSKWKVACMSKLGQQNRHLLRHQSFQDES